MSWFTPSRTPVPRGGARLSASEITVFAMLGTMMFVSKLMMEMLPNIHLLGMLTMVLTLVYRRRALIPIYLFVFLTLSYNGFSPWMIPYLYVWTVLWGVTMLLPRRMPTPLAAVVYPVVCGLHGLAFGALYAPVQAILFNLSFSQMLVWIAAGFPFDVMHALGNLAAGLLILPLSGLLRRLSRSSLRG